MFLLSVSYKGMELLSDICRFTGYSEHDVNVVLQKAPSLYQRYQVPKPSGGFRTIYHPSRQTKGVQYALIELLFTSIPSHSIAFGYIRNLKSPTLQVAKVHAPYAYSVRVDLKDFFYAITPPDLFQALARVDSPLSRGDQRIVERACFLRHQGRLALSIGSPSSPFISNIVMREMDDKMSSLLHRVDQNGGLTRYADDIVFSSNIRGACGAFFRGMQDLLAQSTSPDLCINTRKTIFMSRGDRRRIAGLTITPEGAITIGRSSKRYVRKLVWEYLQDRLDVDKYRYLVGYLNYVRDVEPEFLNDLALKYGADSLHRLLRVGRNDLARAGK